MFNMIEIRFDLGSASISTWQAVARFMESNGFEPCFIGNSFVCNVTKEFADKMREVIIGWGYNV